MKGKKLGIGKSIGTVILILSLFVGIAAAIPIDKKETLGPYGEGHKYYLHIYNVDDIAKAVVNGKLIAQINYQQDSGWIDITNYLTDSSNTIELTDENGVYGGWTYGFEIRQDDSNIIWKDSCGTAGTIGCMNGDGTQGLVYRDIITLVIASTPTLAVLPQSGQQGTIFQYSGNNYTPNGAIDWHVLKPDGTEYPVGSLTADSSGNFSYQYSSSCNSMVGSYTIWAVDKNTGKKSNNVIETISTSPTCTVTPTITVVSPNGGENWQAGSTQTIKWSYTGNLGANVKIELLKSGIVNRIIVPIYSIGSGGTGTYDWKIPSNQILGTDYKIRISSITNSAYKDTSDGDFSISAPTLGTRVKGIDISGNNPHPIDWKKVHDAGIKFTIVKASEGNGWPSENNPKQRKIIADFKTDMKDGKSNGILMGTYHFARPLLGNSGKDEAEWFVTFAHDYLKNGYLRPALDMENYKNENPCLKLGKEKLSKWVNEWMSTVKDKTGIDPILYVSRNYANCLDDSVINKYDLWIADPQNNPNPDTGSPRLWYPTPSDLKWNDWAIWQYNIGNIDGIRKNVDLDVFNGIDVQSSNLVIKNSKIQ